MDADTSKTALEQILEILTRHGVEFLVIGGQAETIHGSPRVTLDVDLCYRRTAENLRRVAAALRELEPSLRGGPPDLPFRIDAEALALGMNYTFQTKAGDLDLLGYVEPLGGFDELKRNAERIQIGDFTVDVLSLDDLIRIKEYLGRPKDKDSLINLSAIRRLRSSRRIDSPE